MKIPITNKDYLLIMRFLSRKKFDKKHTTISDKKEIGAIENIKMKLKPHKNKWFLILNEYERDILVFWLHDLEVEVLLDKRLPRNDEGIIIPTQKNANFLKKVCDLVFYIETF